MLRIAITLPSTSGQKRTIGVVAKLAPVMGVYPAPLVGRMAIPKMLQPDRQLLRVASRDTGVNLWERIAKIYAPLLL
jgi:hypothetical protein